ncbi:hypothetical protein SLEP1_g53031 [Rubroshorea leprosula]|uniref:Uncharacterized protein n=1 Tax=Rubroshorea leprosula TaxID=152421 RepID=A0AAV5MAW9_9ROSI|nr:hypothetical protein SLEP1_g53031 [Rubroshorea leprosula]
MGFIANPGNKRLSIEGMVFILKRSGYSSRASARILSFRRLPWRSTSESAKCSNWFWSLSPSNVMELSRLRFLGFATSMVFRAEIEPQDPAFYKEFQRSKEHPTTLHSPTTPFLLKHCSSCFLTPLPFMSI